MPKAAQFLTVFAGEYVQIITSVSDNVLIPTEDGGQHPVEAPLLISGFVMDNDGVFIYLSEDGENVNQAVTLTAIQHIGIVDLSAKEAEPMDDIDIPDDSSFH